MRLAKRLSDFVYQDVLSQQVFTTVAGLAKMLSVPDYTAEAVIFSYPQRVLEFGVSAGAIKSPEVIAKELLAKMVLAESELACSVQAIVQALGLTDASSKTHSRFLVYIESHLVAKIILDSNTASRPAKSLAQALLLTDSDAQSEELLRAIDNATPIVPVPSRSWMQPLAS